MAQDTRERMIRSAGELFSSRGYAAAGFRDIVDRAGASRGAIYHHFPGGKAELAEAVMQRSSEGVASLADTITNREPEAFLRRVLDPAARRAREPAPIAGAFARGEGADGCPVAGVALSADEDELRHTAAATFASWERDLTDALVDRGIARRRARSVASVAISALEGALLRDRVDGGDAALRTVARVLPELLRT